MSHFLERLTYLTRRRLVSQCQQIGRNFKTGGLNSPDIDNQIKFRRLEHRQAAANVDEAPLAALALN